MTLRVLNPFPAIIAAAALGGQVAAANEPGWIRDFDRAKAEARSDRRPLFILFTGHGWCHACEVMDREVFREAKFVDATARRYVFVELDFNFGDGSEEEKRKSDLMRLRSQYLAPAVPTVVLADSEGRPYAFITGYDRDAGVAGHIDLLATAEKAKQNRDRLFQAAAETTGVARAEQLDSALESVAPLLGSTEDRGDDPLLRFYADTIEQILELTDHSGPLAEKYLARRSRRAEWLASEAVLTALKDFNAARDYAGAINYIEGCLKSTTSDSIRWRLEYSRQVYLEWSGRNADALENSRRLLASRPVPNEYRESLLDREAYNLFRLNRTAEGLAHYDRRIADAVEDKDKRLRLLGQKAQMILGRDPVSQSIAAWEAYRAESKRGSEDWLTATALLARELRRAKSHEKALRLTEEFLQVERATWQLLDAAEDHLALGNYIQVQTYLNEADAANRRLAESPRQSERDEFARVVARIDKLKRKLAENSAPPKRDP